MGRKKKEPQNIFNFNFKASNYIIGECVDLFEKDISDKILKKLKKKTTPVCGYLEDFDIYFFKSITGNGFDDYVESDWMFSAAPYLILTTHTKEGKIYNCKRFKVKKDFIVTADYKDGEGFIYFKSPDDPGPFHMFGEI